MGDIPAPIHFTASVAQVKTMADSKTVNHAHALAQALVDDGDLYITYTFDNRHIPALKDGEQIIVKVRRVQPAQVAEWIPLADIFGLKVAGAG